MFRNITNILRSDLNNFLYRFFDYICFSINFLAIFNGNRGFFRSILTILNNFCLSGFHFRIFDDFNLVGNIILNLNFAFGLGTIFNNFLGWFFSFNLGFKLASFFIEESCYLSLSFFTFLSYFSFTSFHIFIVNIFCFKWKFSSFFNWFYTNSYNSICWIFCFFFCNYFFLIFVVIMCYSCLTIFAWCFFFNLTSFKSVVIDIFCVKSFFHFIYNWFSSNNHNFLLCFYFIFLFCCSFSVRLAILDILRVF